VCFLPPPPPIIYNSTQNGSLFRKTTPEHMHNKISKYKVYRVLGGMFLCYSKDILNLAAKAVFGKTVAFDLGP